MRRIFEFRCAHCDTVTEHYIEDDVKETDCGICGGTAYRIISAVRTHLDGTDPGFPGEYMQWERKRKGHIRKG